MKLFEGHTFRATASTSRSEFLDAIRKFGFFSSVEFKCTDPEEGIFFVREVGVLERLGKLLCSISSKDMYRASNDALLHLSQKNMVLAGVLGRSVFDVWKKPLSARELGDKLKIEEKKFNSAEESVLVMPSEGKMIVTDALLENFSDAHEVDLSDVSDQKYFYDSCRSVLSKARKESPEKVLIVKPHSVSGNDEPSDAEINNLLLAIDEHHQSHPSSRLMISTDGNRLLYERILNIKIQHDAKKFLQSRKSDLGLMDLLMIPARGDEVVKLEPIDEESLKKHQTQFPGIFVYITDCPEMIQSDLSIIKTGTLSASHEQPGGTPAEASKLIWSIGEKKECFLKLADEFQQEQAAVKEKSTLFAARFPAMDLPVKRLIVFQRQRVGWVPENLEYEKNVNKVKNFYLEELRKEQGRVVIEAPERKYACEGLRRAVEELRKEKKGPGEIIVTTSANMGPIFSSFYPPT